MINLPLNNIWLPLLGFIPIFYATYKSIKEKKITKKSVFEFSVGLLVLLISINDNVNNSKESKNRQKESVAQFDELKRSIVDSMKNIYQSPSPILTLGKGDVRTGIKISEKLPNGFYKIALTFYSKEAASAFFDIKYDFLVQGLDSVYRIMHTPNIILKNEMVLGKDEYVTANHIVMASDILILYLWIRGSYKRRDGSGDFKIDNLYGLYPESDSTFLYQGGTKQGVTNLITALLK